MTNIPGWHYYNYALLPTSAPDVVVDVSLIRSGDIWKHTNRKTILVRWTDEFDCGYETQWWYVIKDKPFDITSLNAKRRYEITKGKKNFYVERIDPREYVEELYRVQVAAYSAYPAKYRPKIDKERWQKNIKNKWNDPEIYVFGAFFKDTNELCGYAMLSRQKTSIDFNILRVVPKFEKYAINAAIVAHILEFFEKELGEGVYICDGARNIQHETAFQDYLEKYFGFRKAYCRLNIEYNPHYKLIVKSLYLFKRVLKRLGNIGIIHKINGVLYMEELVRTQKR